MNQASKNLWEFKMMYAIYVYDMDTLQEMCLKGLHDTENNLKETEIAHNTQDFQHKQYKKKYDRPAISLIRP